MTSWVATAFGALDLAGDELSESGYDLVVTPTAPGSPLFLKGEGATVWRRLASGSLSDQQLTDDEHDLVLDLAGMHVAQPLPARVIRRLRRPWLISPIHELVYALLANVAAARGIDIVFIKGPALHAQGLRDREHSGDVDCWVRPGDDLRLAEAMSEWGWTPLLSPFTGTGVTHSLTLRAGEWGCAIDVHRRFPGMKVNAISAFEDVYEHADEREYAGALCRTPDAARHSLIMALHEMRPTIGVMPGPPEIERAAEALRAGGEEVIALAVRFGADFVLEAPLQRAFPEHSFEAVDRTLPEDWEWRTTASAPRRHLKALRTVPVRQRPATFLRLLWPSRAVVETAQGREGSRAAMGWASGNLRRVLRSIAALIRR